MANSSFIGDAKLQIIKELIKNKDIVQAIDSHDVTSPEKLIGKHIFDFHQNPNTINDIITFITIQVHIPQSFVESDVFVDPVVEIWIISHEGHMVVNNVPKVKMNRNDYLSTLIDKSLNGRSDFGIGKLKLISNIEGSYQQNYVYRKMEFKCKEVNDSMCEDE